MKNYNAKNVSEFITSADKGSHAKLNELRKLVQASVPKAEEGISYGVPFYKYHGVLAAFAPYKNHVGIWFPSAPLGRKDLAVLNEKGYVTGSKTIQIKFGQKVPTVTIRQILKSVAEMNEFKAKNKKK